MAEPYKFKPLGQTPSSTPEVWQSPTSQWLGGFGKSALSGMTELVGVELPGVAEWRQDNPTSGFASQLAGFAVPYAGWFKATKLVKPFDRAIDSIGNLDKAPFLTGAAREAARFAPFEIGRLGASQVVGDVPFPDMATDVALSLGAGAGIGGLLHGLAAAGTRTPNVHRLMPGVDITAPLPLQLRKMREGLAALSPEDQARVLPEIRKFEAAARAERADREKYVFSVNGRDGLTRTLNSLFQTRGRAETVVDHRRFIHARDTEKYNAFPSDEAWKAEASAAGLPENFSELGQYFRSVSFRPSGRSDAIAKRAVELFNDLQSGKITPESYQNTVSRMASKDYSSSRATAIHRSLTSGLESLGDGWFLGKEQDGLFVMARKYAGAETGGSPLDKWVVFKTDRPGAFVPQAQRWADMVLEQNSWHSTAAPLVDGGQVYNAVKGWHQHFPLTNYEALRKVGPAARAIEKLTPAGLKGKSSEFAWRLKEGVREYLAPTAYQLKRSPLGNWILQSARVAYDSADTLAHEVVYGRQALSNRNLFLQALRSGEAEPTSDSFKAILDGADQQVLDEVQTLWRNEVDPAEYAARAAAGEISPTAAEIASRLDQLESMTWAEYEKLTRALGETPKKPKKGHLGLSHYWEGDTRIALRDEAGALRAVAAGPNRRAAQKAAEDMLQRWPDLKKAEEFDISNMTSLPKDLQITAGTPGFLNERQGIRGFKWDLTPWTKDELLEAYHRSQSARMRFMADKTVDDLLKRPLAQLAAADPVSHRIATARIRDLQLKQSEFGAWQNKLADQLLAPMIGTNSASKIVGLTNTAMHTWHLGMGNISHPIVNALTFTQTVMPEAAMVLGGAVEDLGHYSYFAAGGTKGPVGGMAVLSPVKLMGTSIREMAKPRPELLKFIQRAANEGVIAPRLVEEYVGETATKVTGLKEALASGKGFAQWLLALSNWLPANSEKLARVHAFTVGYQLARDVLKIQDPDAAYRLARQFTEKTMFLYTAADRPRIFTTPAGSAMGLFKTWMMNYMASMVEYSGQALKGNIAPLAWQTAGTATIGGLAASPLYLIAQGFNNAFSDDSLLQNTYEHFDQGQADAFLLGLPAALTGISLYSQVQSPASNPVRDANMLWSSVTFDRMQALSKSAGLAFDHWQATGEHPGRSAATRDAIVKALAPSTVARSIAAFSGEEMIRSLGTTYPMLENVSLGDRLAYAFKFNPVELDRAMQVQNELYADQTKRRGQVSQLGRAFAEAQASRDTDQMRQILRQATLWGLDVSSVIKSSMVRTERARETQMESTFRAQDIAPYRPALAR